MTIGLIWFGVIGFGVLMYVLLDGFVLGLGILFAVRPRTSTSSTT